MVKCLSTLKNNSMSSSTNPAYNPTSNVSLVRQLFATTYAFDSNANEFATKINLDLPGDLNIGNSSTNYSLSVNGDTVATTAAVNNIVIAVSSLSQWATFPAVSNVDLSRNNIINVSGLTVSNTVTTSNLTTGNINLTSINNVPYTIGVTSLTAGSNIGISSTTGNIVIRNDGVRTLISGNGIAVTSSSGDVTVNNTGVICNTAGSGIGITTVGGNSTITNLGVKSITAGNGIALDRTTGDVVVSTATGIATGVAYTFGQLVALGTNHGASNYQLSKSNATFGWATISNSSNTFNSNSTNAVGIAGATDGNSKTLVIASNVGIGNQLLVSADSGNSWTPQIFTTLQPVTLSNVATDRGVTWVLVGATNSARESMFYGSNVSGALTFKTCLSGDVLPYSPWGSSGSGNGVATDGSWYVAVGTGRRQIAYNRTTNLAVNSAWSEVSGYPFGDVNSVGYAIAGTSLSGWVAVGRGTNQIVYSPYNAVAPSVWNGQGAVFGANGEGSAVVWNTFSVCGGWYVAGTPDNGSPSSDFSNYGQILFSSNGTTWLNAGFPFGQGGSATALAVVNSNLYVSGIQGDGSNCARVYIAPATGTDDISRSWVVDSTQPFGSINGSLVPALVYAKSQQVGGVAGISVNDKSLQIGQLGFHAKPYINITTDNSQNIYWANSGVVEVTGAVTTTTDDNGGVHVNVTGTSVGGSLSNGPGIQLSNAGEVTVISNTGVLTFSSSGGLTTRTNATGNVSINNTGVLSCVAGTGISVAGLGGGGTGIVTIANTGVTSIVAGDGVSINTATGAVTVTNSGVTSLTAGSNTTVRSNVGSVAGRWAVDVTPFSGISAYSTTSNTSLGTEVPIPWAGSNWGSTVIISNTSNIKFSNAGTYKVDGNISFSRIDGKQFTAWLKLNGTTNIAGSTVLVSNAFSAVDVSGNVLNVSTGGIYNVGYSATLTVANNDYIQVYAKSDHSNDALYPVPSNGTTWGTGYAATLNALRLA
jgi:hypothetical protein